MYAIFYDEMSIDVDGVDGGVAIEIPVFSTSTSTTVERIEDNSRGSAIQEEILLLLVAGVREGLDRVWEGDYRGVGVNIYHQLLLRRLPATLKHLCRTLRKKNESASVVYIHAEIANITRY